MSTTPVRHLLSRAATRFTLMVVTLALVTAALVLTGWALLEALRPSDAMILAPGPLPLSSLPSR